MTKTQHTPGPWALDDKTRAITWGDVSFSASFGAGGFVVASHTISTLPTYQSDRLTPEHHANARLIAAAPELLEVLGALMVTIDAQIDAGLRWDPETVAAARAAIAKATGAQS
jgi:hypothetical protein